jgi:hypothetical protein
MCLSRENDEPTDLAAKGHGNGVRGAANFTANVSSSDDENHEDVKPEQWQTEGPDSGGMAGADLPEIVEIAESWSVSQ